MINKVQFDVVCLGELLVDMFSERIKTEDGEVEVYLPKPGGAPANVAVGTSRLGLNSAFIGKVGDDQFGHWLKGVLEKEKVNIEGLCFDKETRTTLAIINDSDSEMPGFTFYRNPGADQKLSEDDLNLSIIRSTKILHLGSVSLSAEPARSTTFRAVEAVRQSDGLISFDVNFRPKVWKESSEANQQIKRMLSRVDIVKVNDFEATLITGINEINTNDLNQCKKAAQQLIEKGPKCVVITLGAKGSYFQLGSKSGFVPAFQTKSIDMVGCGDAFVAGLLHGISTEAQLGDIPEKKMHKILMFANAVGALTSTRRGAIPAMPTLIETEEFLSKYSEGIIG